MSPADNKSPDRFTPYQTFVVASLAFLQFAVILDFMIVAPLGALVMPALDMSPRDFGLNALGAATQQVSGGIASVIAGHIVTMAPGGKLEQFPVVGYVVVCATLMAMFTTWKMKQDIEQRAATARPVAA